MEVLLPSDRGRVASAGRAGVIADWLRAWRGGPATVRLAPDYESLEEAVRRATADLVWAPPLVCARVADLAQRMLVCVRHGQRGTRAALIVREDSRVESLSGLAGARAAWVDPLSVSGHLAPRALLRAHGLDPGSLFRSEGFHGSYRDALLALSRGEADVSAFYARADATIADVMPKIADVVGAAAKRLRVLEMSQEWPNDALILTARLSTNACAELAERLVALRARGREPAMLLEHVGAERVEAVEAPVYACLQSLTR